MKKNQFLNLFVISLCALISTNAHATSGPGCAAGYDCSPRGVGDTAAGNSCGNAAWEERLVGAESGGSYTIGAPNSSARGRYQFINSTRASISASYNLPCGGQGDGVAFDSCPGLQDDYFRALVEENMNLLESTCNTHCGTVHGGVEVTMSGLLAMAHNVGYTCARQWAEGGEGNMTTVVAAGQPPCRDANGTNAVERYAAAMGGFDVGGYGASANCGFDYVPGEANPMPYQGPGSAFGCDPEILERGVVITDSLNQVNAEIIRASIQPPSSVEELTCLDQQLRVLDAAGDIHATPGNTLSDGNDGTQIRFDNLTYNPLEEQLSSLMDIPGSISSIVNNIWSSLVGSFDPTSALTGGTSTNCDVMEQTWMLNQCIELPQLPSLSDVITGRIGELSGAITSAPDRILEQVCSAASSQLGLATGDISSMFDNAADDALTPITDSLP